ncbi:hypothetical protein FACS1894186_1910 [Alphaproteobacteria bacterium]|nr:hypothetical protein FACS1894186_1910 [Alphaproteobacteria bacterium]
MDEQGQAIAGTGAAQAAPVAAQAAPSAKAARKKKRWIPRFMASFVALHENSADADTTDAQATRMINVYRQIHVLAGPLVGKLNNELLELPAEVLAKLPDMPGGAEVIEYIRFLEDTRGIAHADGMGVDGADGDSGAAAMQAMMPTGGMAGDAMMSMMGGGGGGVSAEDFTRLAELITASQEKTAQIIADAIRK